MPATITWTISQLDCYPQADGHTDVVTTAHYQCTGVQDTFTSQVYSTCSFPPPEGPDWTPYDQLTQDQVLGWCWENGVDKAATEAAVQTQIDNQITPVIVSPPLPWSSAPQQA